VKGRVIISTVAEIWVFWAVTSR